MSLVLKKSIGFIVILFIIGFCIDYYTGKEFTPSYFVSKLGSCILAGVIYYLLMSYFTKKAK